MGVVEDNDFEGFLEVARGLGHKLGLLLISDYITVLSDSATSESIILNYYKSARAGFVLPFRVGKGA